MNPLSQHFNAQAHWSLYIAPLFMMLILDDIARRETCRHKRIARLDRRFNAKAARQSREQYSRQVAETYAPRQISGPRV